MKETLTWTRRPVVAIIRVAFGADAPVTPIDILASPSLSTELLSFRFSVTALIYVCVHERTEGRHGLLTALLRFIECYQLETNVAGTFGLQGDK